jgi:ankyrin repeat protein
MAQVKGRREVVAALLDAGADADAATLKGNTPLLFAANAGNCECARLLIERGACVNAQNKSDGDTSLHRYSQSVATRAWPGSRESRVRPCPEDTHEDDTRT